MIAVTEGVKRMVTFQNEISLGAYEQYVRSVKQTSQLLNEEEAQLLHSIGQGKVERTKQHPDVCIMRQAEQARERLVAGYQPLLISLARRYVRHCQEMDVLDLVQEGNIGLLQAIEKYNEAASTASFRTWAFSWVRGLMLLAIWQYEGAIQLPREKERAIRHMGIVNTRLLSELHREPTIAETARAMRLSEDDVRDLIILQEQVVVSFHAFPDDDEDYTLEDTIADPGTLPSADEDVHDLLKDALVMLPERERLIINLRYGFEDGQARTQREVASLLNVALSTVTAIDRRAQIRLRHYLSA